MIPDALRDSLERCKTLPSPSSVVFRVIELARDPDVSLQKIVAVLHSDPALSASLLSLANSVFYASHRPVEHLQEAINRIGLERTLSMALSCSLAAATTSDADPSTTFDNYWQRSLVSALIARQLATTLEQAVDSGVLFTAALLQDIGMLALYASDRDNYRALCTRAANHAQLVELERDHYGVDHAAVGAWLAQRWRLSERTVSWIGASHEHLQGTAVDECRAASCIIASGRLADAWLQGETALSAALGEIEVTFGVDTPTLVEAMMALQEDVPAIAAAYRIEPPKRLDGQRLLYASKQLLAEQNAQLQQDLIRQQQEIERLKDQQQSLSKQVRCDPLTQLGNRRYLEETLEKAFVAASQGVSVVFIDLDRFKMLNDTHGHAFGDAILCKLAALLETSCTLSKAHVGRYGGEEFVIVLSDHDGEQAWRCVEGIRRELANAPWNSASASGLPVTASYGIATHGYGECFATPQALLSAADGCMYSAKYAGGDRVSVHQGGLRDNPIACGVAAGARPPSAC
ncbi:HDOD domain-containing protein [Halomonas sp. HP20-15]|uniref:sensor domain-containing diguanylate cyclase n=1 Tax=Halomonas sp. HP20-15 TaxID=3085901 RepID=UPI002981114F|nr:HDOD domain-containing protein [Halomonas sp. HP20-15]MDW5376872.1 HDOD domain-containing protein [Halomonas sp. HP20-15]